MRIAVTGVAHVQPAEGGAVEPRLYLRSGDDVSVLALPLRPPSWTPVRVLLLGLGFASVVGLCGLWVWSLRRQVRKQTEVITANFEREAQLSESLRRVRNLEAIGRLSAGIAHDFNNLLTVILGNSDMLARHLKDDPVAREMVALTVGASERAAGLTRQLLTFSRQTLVHLEPIDLNAVLHEAEKLLTRVIGEHVRLVIECAPDLPLVRADFTLLNQIVLNLAANARDAMAQGGTLTLKTGLARPERAASLIRLTVSDTGSGMDEQTRQRIFEPFFTTKETGKGTGLGLATVYGAVSMLHGLIQVQSAVGVGSTFLIDLQPANAAVPEPPPPTEPPHGQGTVILLVDDDDGIRKVLGQAFERYGYKLLSAAAPMEAMEVARAHKGKIDLLVSDLIMPGMNGRDMATLMRITQPKLRVLFMTGYPPDEVARIVGNLPDVAVLAKPFIPIELVTKVQEMLEEGVSRVP
jgi:signal transduction histidine kinase